eukprot:TRINITY_DN114750_c0_g1_i1.p1 TRINITY_DN114750_c0_g1~~TRINITY_DN114750_c0_g1_i1.p1  ORF type:complete len:101 (-),score=16.00 TRINITY_DN114750_c0_g1_i1:46-348(-)
MTSSVPLRFICAHENPGRPAVTFSEHEVPQGGKVLVEGNSAGGWVFCGLLEDGCGDFTTCQGGSIELLEGWSNDDSHVTFSVLHDGSAEEVVMTYNTRAD